MPSSVTLQALGLNVSQNQLQAPEGSLIKASNVIVRRSGVIESRRGFKLYGNTFGTTGTRVSQIIEYKNTLLRHFDSTLQFDDSAGTFTSFEGTYNNPQTGLRIKSIEANGNLYFTTSVGIKKLSARVAADFSSSDNLITDAGGIKALDATSTLKPTTTATPWMTNDSVVAYRTLWGIKDANTNLILGTPSERTIVYNPMNEMIVRDYMRLLGALDDINRSGCLIDDGDYVDSLKVDLSIAPIELRLNLIDLTTKIDADIIYADVGSGAPLDMTGATYNLTSNVLTINFASGDATNYFSIGSKININGLDVDLNGPRVIVNVTTSTIQITITHTNIGATPIPGATTITSDEFGSITQPGVPDAPATNAELQELETYLTKILDTLQTQVNGVIPTSVKNTYIDVLSITAAATVNIKIIIPTTVTTNHFYQIYRTSLLTAVDTDILEDLVPSDEMRLVYENNPTAADIANGFVIVEDITPDSFAGANLYTNPTSGEGIVNANDIPPLAKDINKFKDVVFYANTQTKHRFTIQLLGVTSMVDAYDNGDVPAITLSDGMTDNTYYFVTGSSEVTVVTCTNKASLSDGDYFFINTAANEKRYYVWFDVTGSATDPAVSGRTGIKVDISDAALTTATDVASRLRDVLAVYVDDFSTSSTAADVTVTNNAFGICDDATAETTGFTFAITQGRGERSAPQITDITTVADVAGSLAGTYFNISDAFNQHNYYVWYRVSGVGIDPLIANKTGVMVEIATNDSASTVASVTATKLATLTLSFTASALSNVLTVRNKKFGPCLSATVGTSGFSISIPSIGALNVLLSDSASPAQAVDETMRSFIRVVNLKRAGVLYAFNLSSTDDLPGKVLLEARTLINNPIYILADSTSTGNSFTPTISPMFDITNISAAPNAEITTATPHGLVSGDEVMLANTNSVPNLDGLRSVITLVDATRFTIERAVVIAGTQGSGANVTDCQVSENEQRANRIYYSKIQQPEAVPVLNYFDVGSKDKAILRIMPLRDSLFVFKEDGVYRISGEVAPFTTSLFDSTGTLIAPDSLAPANNLLYAWMEEGVSVISEGGIVNISRPIDTLLLKIQTYTNFRTATNGVGYHSDNSYTVYTVNQDSDELSTIGYRYSNLTNSWTSFDRGSTCALVASFNDMMYTGASDTNSLEKERKSFTRRDYADRELSKVISPLSYQGNQISLASVVGVASGDIIVQRQYVTVYKFNTLLLKLDIDTILATDYHSTLIASNAADLSMKLDALIVKIRDDAGRLAVPSHTPSSDYTALIPTPPTFEGLRDTFNSLMTLLNADSGVGFSDYASITRLTDFETIITSVSQTQKKITIKDENQFIQGPITIYKSIPTSVTYAAQTLNDPLSLKQLYDATLMLEARSFTNFRLSFASDLLPSFETISFTGDSSGAFGTSNDFGNNFFGGGSNSAPLRTIIPRNKQRCRYLMVNFEHSTAFEQYAVLGITLTGNVTSVRGFR